MNADIPPLDPPEAALELELRSMAPLAPSSSLKDRIRQAASELDSAPAPPELPRMSEATARKNVVEVPFWRKPGFVAAAAALVVGLFAAKFFFSPDESEPAMASLIGDPDDELIIWGNPPRVSIATAPTRMRCPSNASSTCPFATTRLFSKPQNQNQHDQNPICSRLPHLRLRRELCPGGRPSPSSRIGS